MNTTRRFSTATAASLGGAMILGLAAEANAQHFGINQTTIIQHQEAVAVPVAIAPALVAPIGQVAFPHEPVAYLPAVYPSVLVPAPTVVYAAPQVVYMPPAYRTYAGHTRTITYGGYGRRLGHGNYRRHGYSRHGRRGVSVNFGLRVGH